MSRRTIFLLSPAHCGGKRAALLFNDRAQFSLAHRIRQPAGVPLGEVFSFLSGLYFRGKLAYAAAFACPSPQASGAYLITSNRGLLSPDIPVTLADLRAFGCVEIDSQDDRYRMPLERDARALAQSIGPDCQVILLGSIATGKYVDVLLGALGDSLRFPSEFIGRGDMSRGGLMLRCAQSENELTYIPISGAIRKGKRPPKLERRG